MRICFSETYTVKAVDGKTYKQGKTYDVVPSTGRHFINKGVAREVVGGAVTAPETASVEPAETAVRPRGRPRTVTSE
jgi:hypothetical protein